MSRIKLNSPLRVKKRSLSSYASFALFVAATAIALSAVILRIGKDRMIDGEDDTMTLPSGQTVATSPVEQAENEPSSLSTTSQTTASKQKQTTMTVKKTAEDEYDDREDSEETMAIQVIGGNRSYVRPSGGAIIKPCSIKELAYSRTMNDWRVHNGLDIAAEKGEIVKSVAEGTVSDVMHDSLYGTTIVINQNDGLMVYYRGLNKDTAVREGDFLVDQTGPELLGRAAIEVVVRDLGRDRDAGSLGEQVVFTILIEEQVVLTKIYMFL